jgi:peptide/nickel transport system permease protein
MALTLETLGATRPGGGQLARPRAGSATAHRLGRWAGIYVPVILTSTFVTFFLGSMSNANPAASVLGDNATPQDITRINHVLGLDQPLVVQYGRWLWRALQGDLGVSYFTQIPVSTSISQRLPVDLSLAVLAVGLALVVGGTAGALAAVRRGSLVDRAVTWVCSAGSTVPAFVLGIGLVVLFSVTVKLLPSSGYVGITVDPVSWLQHIALPAVALSVEPGIAVARQLRTALVDVLDQNYVTGAVVRGLSGRRILLVHALRNAAGPALTVLGISVPVLVGGTVVTETVFSLPGLGQLVLSSATSRDVPVVQGVLLVTSTLVIASNLFVNAALGWLRPGVNR